MSGTNTGPKKIFRVAENIQLADIKKWAHGYFGLQVIGNIDIDLPDILTVSAI